ncbi:MAG: hypothetical protein ACOYBL_02910 [Lachnospiraceae bacterium]|jgi:hypothetical protein
MRKQIYGIGLLYAVFLLILGFTGAYTIRHTNTELTELRKEMRSLKASQTAAQPQMTENGTMYTFQHYNADTGEYDTEAYRLISYSSEQVVLRQMKEENRSFLLKEDQGYVTVYLEDGTTVFEYTAIAVTELPQELQEELQEGKQIESSDALYSFLENYSS